jgi:hypothetical protein
MVLEELERRGEKLLPLPGFYRRLIAFGILSLLIILVSLVIGILGYMSFEGMDLIDAFLNAAMLMGGHGSNKRAVYPEWKNLRGYLCDVLRVCADLFGCTIHDTDIPPGPPHLPPRGERLIDTVRIAVGRGQ